MSISQSQSNGSKTVTQQHVHSIYLRCYVDDGDDEDDANDDDDDDDENDDNDVSEET